MTRTTMKTMFKLAAGALAMSAAAQAHAGAVNATLSATYYQVAAGGTDADFPGGFPTVAAGSSLGANGLPVGTGVADLTAGGEITWWAPSLNANVVQTGTGTISLPYASNMYAPNSTGSDDSDYFETAVFRGIFNLANAGTVSFNLGSDDDTFIYVDGTLFGQNPGIHATSNVDFTTPTLDAGNHSLAVFYADRQHTGAYLSLNLNSTDVVIVPPSVPEPASWAMMIGGFGVLGFAFRRAYRKSEENFTAKVREIAAS